MKSKMSKKTARCFVDSLSVAQLKFAVMAYSRSIRFEETFKKLQENKADEMPEHLQATLKLLKKPHTIKELAVKLNSNKDTVWTYISKLRKKGVKISSRRVYRKTTYWR